MTIKNLLNIHLILNIRTQYKQLDIGQIQKQIFFYADTLIELVNTRYSNSDLRDHLEAETFLCQFTNAVLEPI